ncbi:hypothetical protein [Methylobacter sp.]|uniref:hypothetical protein n=1 Tax=Methylobacter sp. TaxID=2051955 RepID=UPI0012196195|nr:hypothetical protein [Methylobacter sp.]TAK64883.1 MAG: hypothetical protein EPO18_01535 [Methylobacter sp.]
MTNYLLKSLLYERWNTDDADLADLHGFLPVESGVGSYGCMNAGAVAESFAIRGLKQGCRNRRNRLYVLSV